ncbi:MAG TPA: hypothetical protein P5572_14300 [Phycisphaerae bacterium]|nr:hypothetical protein [Phycisphaerae bacterium]
MSARFVPFCLPGAGICAGLAVALAVATAGCDGSASNPTPSPQPECSIDADCGSNAYCEADACVAATDATKLHVTLGYMELNDFVAVPPGTDMHLYVGFQGASHILTALLLAGPEPPGDVRLAWTISNASDGAVLSMTEARLSVFPTDEPGVYRLGNQLMQFASRATALDGRDVVIDITLYDASSGDELTTYSQAMRLNIRES